MGVRADLEVAAVLALVHVGVHVADDRELDLAGVCANCGTGPTPIIWWTAGVSGMDAPAIARDPWAPDAAGDDDGVRGDVALVGADAADVAVDDVDAGDLVVGREGQRAHRLGPLAHDRARPGASRRRRRRAYRSRRGSRSRR